MDNQNILHNDLRLFPKHTVQCQIDMLCWESIRDISFPQVSISSVARQLYTTGSQLLSVCSYLRFELQYIVGNSHKHRHNIPFLFSFLVYSPGPTFAITGVQKQSEAALLHVRVDGVVSA